MAANAEVVLESEERGIRSLPIDEKFFLGYRKTVIAMDEIVKAIWVPKSGEVLFMIILLTISLESVFQGLQTGAKKGRRHCDCDGSLQCNRKSQNISD